MFKNKKFYLVLGLILVLAAGSMFLVRNTNNSSFDESTAVESSGTINFDPPTEQELAAGDSVPAKSQDNETAEAQSEESSAGIIVTDASQYDDIIEVRSFIPGVVDSGTCTIVLSQQSGGEEITATVEATPQASSTSCTSFQIERSEFSSSGQWDFTINYSGEASSGTASGKVTVE